MAPIIRLLLSLTILLVFLHLVCGSPPEAVIKCAAGGNTDCTVTNGFATFPDRSTCRVAEAAFPTDELELLQVVSNASKKKQHMKAVTRYSHSIPKLSCPGGPDGEGLAISTEKLNKVIAVDLERRRMTFGAGITLHDLLDAAAKHGLALPTSPYWLGVTLGGMIGTGAHGSSLFGKGSAVHEYVVGVQLVVPRRSPEEDGYYAKVVELGEGDMDLLAAKVSIGVLGVLSQVTLQLEPMFKRSVTYRAAGGEGFEESIRELGAKWRFGDITWFPNLHATVYRYDTDLPESTHAGGGFNDFDAFQPVTAAAMISGRTTEAALEAAGNDAGICKISKASMSASLRQGYGFRNHGSLSNFTGYPVIGNQNDMQAGGSCLFGPDDNLSTACRWDPRLRGSFFFNTAVAIPLNRIAAFVSDVKKLRDLNPAGALCTVELYSGILFRYIRASTAYLGRLEDSAEIDIMYYRSTNPNQPRPHEDVMEEIEQMAFFKYGGIPHLGKNRNVAFVGVKEKLGEKIERFVEVMKRYDEQGLFSSDWTDSVLGLDEKKPTIERRGCALEGLCICSSDEHCAPEKGYYCRSGRVYEEARVCRKVAS